MSVNFNAIPDKVEEFPLIPEGIRTLAISEVTIDNASNGGRNLIVKLSDAESKANSMEFIFFEDANGAPQPYGMSRIKKLLVAVNRLPETETSIDIIPTLLAGGVIVGEIKHSKPNAAGKVYANIGDWNTVTNVATTPVQTVAQAPVETLTKPQVNEEVQNAVIDDEIDI